MATRKKSAKNVAKNVVKSAAKKAAPRATKPATKPAAKPPAKVLSGAGLDLQRSIEQFLYRQSELLDARRWAEYIDLFAADGIYWMPPGPEYTTWDGMPAIFAEDRDLMTVRMKRVTHPHAWSQQAEWGTNHVVSNVTIERIDPKTGDVHVRSRFHMMELRRDDLRHFGGTYRHHLARAKDSWRIKLQRVDMVNSQAPYEYVLQVWV